MTAIDRKAVIAKAREVSQAVYLATDKGVADDIRDTIKSLLALVPEPAEDEREELESIVQAEDERWDGARSSVDFSTQVADAILAAGYTRRPLPTEEEIARLAAARGLVSETTIGLTPSTREVLRLGFMSGARAVLALLTKGQDR